jgi:hypothetical protein
VISLELMIEIADAFGKYCSCNSTTLHVAIFQKTNIFMFEIVKVSFCKEQEIFNHVFKCISAFDLSHPVKQSSLPEGNFALAATLHSEEAYTSVAFFRLSFRQNLPSSVVQH